MANSTRRPPYFKISVPGDEERKRTILQKLQQVREILMQNLNHPVNNGDILEKSLDCFIEKHTNGECQRPEAVNMNTFIQVERNSVDQKIFSTAECSLARLLKVVENHSETCKGKLSLKKYTQKGHVASIRFICSLEKHHSFLWSSSPWHTYQTIPFKLI